MPEVEKRKRGRPAKSTARKYGVHTKFNYDEKEEIKQLSKRDGKSEAEILRIGYRLYKKHSDEMAALLKDVYDEDYEDYD